MQNIEYKLLDRKLQLTVDLDVRGTATGRGNELVASSSNWVAIPELPGYSLNMVLVKREAKKQAAGR